MFKKFALALAILVSLASVAHANDRDVVFDCSLNELAAAYKGKKLVHDPKKIYKLKIIWKADGDAEKIYSIGFMNGARKLRMPAKSTTGENAVTFHEGHWNGSAMTTTVLIKEGAASHSRHLVFQLQGTNKPAVVLTSQYYGKCGVSIE